MTDDSAPFDPFVLSFFPEQEKIIPFNNVTADDWVIVNNNFFRTQWIQCSYQISGGYGHVPRYIYYTFILTSIMGRRTAWLTSAALGLVMTYSAAAAIHALALVSVRKRMAPDIFFQGNNYEIVQAGGPSWAGYSNSTGDELWLPVLPMAWDDDGDAILAIVGTALLVLLPMQIWSSTLHLASNEKKALVGIWGFVLFIGMISALIYVAYVDFWSFPQLRFCPIDWDDPLPFQNQGPYPYAGHWVPGDWYRWNRILGEHFVFGNSSINFPNACLYPCLAFKWPMRDPSEIYVVSGSYGETTDTEIAWWSLICVYYLVSTSCFSSLWLVLATHTKLFKKMSRLGIDQELIGLIRTRGFNGLWRKAVAAWTSGPISIPKRMSSFCGVVISLYVSLFAFYVSPFTLVAFVVYCEWAIWSQDPGGESFHNVGQWGALVGAVAVIGSGAFSAILGSRKKTQGPRGWWRH